MYSVPSQGWVTISIYDNLGGVVKKLFEESQTAGTYRVTLDGSVWASGVYFAVVRFNAHQTARRIILVR